ncbi:GreA/GreB family elongation factor [Ramlibacter sp. MMS24-I3-19]|uniref:GreA/GreB family elongation factor n=1 Tax=Ramlibacter sp. MMS24-I3-19 TaxID=3416606 RepID=UPI003CFDCED6
MHPSSVAGDRQLTSLDCARLRKLRCASHDDLAALLDEADVLQSEAIPPDVVTMRATVLLEHLDGGTTQQITISYPQDADAAAGRVSVLSPVGLALLGQRAGAIARWKTPANTWGAARIAAVVFQPEAHGDCLA